MTKPGLYVAVGDMHYPHVHIPTFNAILDFIRRNRKKIAGYVDLGDTFDNESISPHNKNKPIYQKPGSFKAETDGYEKDILTPLESVLPKHAAKVMITGNHSRWEQDFVDQHPGMDGVVDRFEALKLEERGWEIVPLGLSYEIGKLVCIHGDQLAGAMGYQSAIPAKKAVEVYGHSVLSAHTHSPQMYTRVSPVDADEKRAGYVVPTLGTTNARFMRNRPNAWVNGFAIVEVREDGSFNCYLVITVNGQFTFAGETYGTAQC